MWPNQLVAFANSLRSTILVHRFCEHAECWGKEKEINLDAIIILARRAKEQREQELAEAFKSQHSLTQQVLTDATSVVAGSMGYVAPETDVARREWIRSRMLDDPFFVASVRAIENLVLEYIEAGRRYCEPQSGPLFKRSSDVK